jgi:sulfate adenylyltransferase large subunit
MAAPAQSIFSIAEFLANEGQKDLLRFSTAGSVDDGKSTLIGRLLYDTQSVYEDQVRSIEGKGTTAPGQLDFALLTDGLRAEREQGITIDVAYRYFSTPRRKFIIADTPGHEQYTRNMATGASTADAAVVLVDAGKGVLPQSRRHAFIASLLRVRHVIVAVNKMDLVEYSESRFRAIEQEFRAVLDRIAEETGNPVETSFVPVSALVGNNVVSPSAAMPWYSGPALLGLLESLPASQGAAGAPFRFPVQRVVRPDHTFRGFSGQIASGTVRPGDAILALPSRKKAIVERIVTWDGDLPVAQAPLSVTLVLDREIDISRGDLIAAAESPALVAAKVKAATVWMDQHPLELQRRYLVKLASQTVPALISNVDYRANIATLAHEPAQTLDLNDIGGIGLQFLRPVALDLYKDNRTTGNFIVIDPLSNGTVAAGMIIAAENFSADQPHDTWGPVTSAERAARWGHRGTVLELSAPDELIDAIERSLFSVGAVSVRLDADSNTFLQHPNLLVVTAELHAKAGLITLVTRATEDGSATVRLEDKEQPLDATAPNRAIAEIHRLLGETLVLISQERAGI